MTFNSVAYLLFLPVVVSGHWLLRGRARMAWLLVASYVFYGAWDWRFLGLLWFSTAVDFVIAQLIDGSDDDRRRRVLIFLSVGTQLSLLATFKYFNFFIDSASDLLDNVGLGGSGLALKVILPVGISFYTFQTMGYTIDVYRRRIHSCRDPLLFATFVGYFPQLVAGPIERAEHMLPQLAADRPRPTWARIESGLVLILLGLVMKVVIGDSMAPIVNQVFNDPEAAGSIGALAGVVAFAIQIYADFAGYTAIARGSSRLLGIELVHNFREPYLSRHIAEFWRRWHISLSSWLRDYLYISLGGSRRGTARTYVNLMITMLLGGLWHGAGWNFVIWGGLHGMYLCVHRWRHPDAPVVDDLPRTARALLSTLTTFGLVCFAWIFFRAPTASDAFDVIRAIGRLDLTADVDKISLVPLMAAVVIGLDVVSRLRTTRGWRPEKRVVLAGAGTGLAIALLLVFSGRAPVPFVYFQF